MGRFQGLFIVSGIALSVALDASDGIACGACANGPAPASSMRASSVTDHRMVLAVSSARTTLWDQLRFAGDPKQFLWILPVTSGAQVEIAVGSNAFIDALDDASAPSIYSPTVACDDAGVASYSPVIPPSAPQSGAVVTATGERSNLGSTGRAAVGPYAAELVRSERESLTQWLSARGFAVPAGGEAAIRHYESMRSNFIVVQFRPGASVQQIQPIRVSTEGYNPVLPLRFAAIGAGENVGLSLMVIAPTAMVPEGWPTRVISNDELTWDFRPQTSDYLPVLSSTFTTSARPWVVESTSEVSVTELLARIAVAPMPAAALPQRGVIPAFCPFPDEQIDPIRGPDLDGGCADDVCAPGAQEDAASADAAIDPRCIAQPSSLTPPLSAPLSDTSNLLQVMSSRGVLTRLHIRLGPDGFDRDLALSAADPTLEVPVSRALSNAKNGCRTGSAGATGMLPGFPARLRAPGCSCAVPTRAHARDAARTLAFAAVSLALVCTTRRRRPR